MKTRDQGFKQSDFVTTPLGIDARNYLKYRGITANTVTETRVASDGQHLIFNYYQNNQIIQAKYRKISEKGFFRKGKGRCLYNIDAIRGQKMAVIAEGELDVLSLHEAGIKNAVSLDFGAPNPKDSSDDYKMKCLEECAEVLTDIETFILFCDSDSPGQRANESISRRLGKEKCLIAKCPPDCNDPNDVLVKYGTEELRECIEKAEPIPVTGIIPLQEVWPDMLDQFRNGLKKGLPTGISSLDGHFSWLMGELTLFTGLANSGKSEFVKYLLCLLIKNEGLKFAVFSPETYPASSFYTDWIHTYSGKNPDPDFPNQMTEDEFSNAAQLLKSHVYYVYPDLNEKHTPATIREKIKQMTLIHGLDGYVIDPWNMLLHEGMGNREDLYISDQLSQFARVNHEHDLHGIIVAHPKSIPSGTIPNPYHHISGGPMFINKSDNCVVIHRPNYSQDKQDRQVDFMIEKIRRQKLVGIPTTVSFAYDRRTARYTELHSSQFPVATDKILEATNSTNDDTDLPF